MPITPLPTPPSRQDPANFATRADDFLGALPAFATQANALEAENAAAATAAANAVLTSKVTGPASATANALAKFDGTTGKLVKVSGLVEDAAGNFGLGVTPSAWDAGYKAIQLAGSYSTALMGAGNQTELTTNAYFGSGAWRYVGSSVAASRYGQEGGVHKWYTAPSGTAGNPITFAESGRFDLNGNLLVGVTSGAMHTFVKNSASNWAMTVTNSSTVDPYGLLLSYSGISGGAGNYFLYCSDASAPRFAVLGNGNVQNINNSYGALSDLKLKENIVDVTPKLAKLLQVRIVNYTLKADPNKTKLMGVIAQELEQISPGLIEETPDYEEVKKTREVEVPAVEPVLDADGNEVTPGTPATTRTEEYTERVPLGTVTKSVKYSVFVPMLIKGMQEQQAQIEALQSQLDTQNTAVQLLVARLEALEAK